MKIKYYVATIKCRLSDHLWVNIEYVEIRTIMGMEMLKLIIFLIVTFTKIFQFNLFLNPIVVGIHLPTSFYDTRFYNYFYDEWKIVWPQNENVYKLITIFKRFATFLVHWAYDFIIVLKHVNSCRLACNFEQNL